MYFLGVGEWIGFYDSRVRECVRLFLESSDYGIGDSLEGSLVGLGFRVVSRFRCRFNL